MSLPQSVLDDLHVVAGIKYINFVSSSILVYDYLLTFHDEIKYIWPWEWRSGKILYLITRYSAFIDLSIFHAFWFKPGLDAKDCEHLFGAGCWTLHAGIIITEWIIIMRTYAIWGQSRVILAILVLLVLGTDVPTFFFLEDLLKKIKWAKSPIPSIVRCTVTILPNKLYLYVTMIMILELVVVVLTVWRAVMQRTKGNSRSGLLVVLYRDGVLFFACLFVVSVLNFALQVNSNLPSKLYMFLLPELQRVMHSVLTSKIILHLREYTARTPGYDTVALASTIPMAFVAAERSNFSDETTLDSVCTRDDDFELRSRSRRSQQVSA